MPRAHSFLFGDSTTASVHNLLLTQPVHNCLVLHFAASTSAAPVCESEPVSICSNTEKLRWHTTAAVEKELRAGAV
jgi:hypothetical protein